ncbi:MAG: hypothetical protein KDA24_17635 [Deltaproteobacteria bacterium]|nr:hypothetical protein [Deltaproteobacteria bacterium]
MIPPGARALEKGRAAGYLGALRAGLEALAPNADYVPLREALATVDVLHPKVIGSLADPAEVDERSGLPSLSWVFRASGALGAAEPVPAEDLARAMRLDPAIGERMAARSRLADRRSAPLLPTSRLRGAVRRRGATTDFVLTFDRMTPDGLWMRMRVDLTGPAGWEDRGPVRLNPDGSVDLHEGLSHLMGRHLLTAIGALCLQLQDGTGALVTRLSRGVVGPFWFPGQRLPEGVPAGLARGLVLHGSREILGREVATSADQDPLHRMLGEREERLPPEMGLTRERRFAATTGLHGEIQRWAQRHGCAVTVAPLLPG